MRFTMPKMLVVTGATVALAAGTVGTASAGTPKGHDHDHGHGHHHSRQVDTEITDISRYAPLRDGTAYIKVSYRCDSDVDYSKLKVALTQGDTEGNATIRNVTCDDWDTQTAWVAVSADDDDKWGGHDRKAKSRHSHHDEGFEEGYAKADATLTTYTDGDRDSDSERQWVKLVEHDYRS